MSRFLNIPEGTGDFERLRLIYKSLVDECKDSKLLIEELQARVEILQKSKFALEGKLEAADEDIVQLERAAAVAAAKLARVVTPKAGEVLYGSWVECTVCGKEVGPYGRCDCAAPRGENAALTALGWVPFECAMKAMSTRLRGLDEEGNRAALEFEIREWLRTPEPCQETAQAPDLFT